MPRPEATAELGEQLFEAAAVNYVSCLGLPSESSVLIVVDRKPQKKGTQVDPNRAVRQKLSQMIGTRLQVHRHRVCYVGFGHSSTRSDIFVQTSQALSDLDSDDERPPEARTMAIVYLGDAWENGSAIYDAAKDVAKERQVRVAGSLGFRTGDCRVMSQLSAEKRTDIEKAGRHFEGFFVRNPQGKLMVLTHDRERKIHSLKLDYDLTQAPFKLSLGQFEVEETGDPGEYNYQNVPSGEIYFPPFPWLLRLLCPASRQF